MQTPPPLPGTRSRSWLGRHWKWFVPLSCLVLLAGFGGLFALLLTLMKSSYVYSGAVARTHANSQVIAALGTPIKDGFLFTGNISEVNSSGSANFEIPISGPKGTAVLYVSATRLDGKWHFDELVVQINETKQRINFAKTNELPAMESTALKSRPAEK